MKRPKAGEKAAENRKGSARRRLDLAVCELGLAPSRKRAQALILAGKVWVDGQPVAKASAMVKRDAEVTLKEPDHPYVSRGGVKLERALRDLDVDFTGKVVLDVGASTGGFTDCLLKHGADRVIALDVGYGQLDWKLRCDDRVMVVERTNIRHVEPGQLPVEPGAAVIDVSFISLKLVLPVVARLLPPRSPVVALIKPQFELDRAAVGPKHVVTDPEKHRKAVESVESVATGLGFQVSGVAESPILGPKGNREFLLALHTGPDTDMTGASGGLERRENYRRENNRRENNRRENYRRKSDP